MAKHKKKQHAEEEGGEAWLLPYSDLMTLLLAVFIVLFAVSQVDVAKSAEMAAAFQSGMMTGGAGVLNKEGDSVIPKIIDEVPSGTGTETGISQEELEKYLGQQEIKDLEKLKEEMDQMFSEEGISAEVSTHLDRRGLVISLSNAILFDSGSAEIKPQNEKALLQVAKIVSTLDKYLRIEGHTDNIPIHTDTYPSNWELSSARAASVVRFLLEGSKILPDRLVAVGYGDNKPIANNATAEGRAKNRRIDIIVLSEKYVEMEKEIAP